MENEKSIEEMTEIFGSLFYITNRLQTIIDRSYSAYGLTAKQWFLVVVIERFFTEPPKLIDVAEAMGSSYQNVKQLALKLESKGFAKLERDPLDKRAIRISLTDQCGEFSNKHAKEGIPFLNQLFSSYTPQDVSQFLIYLSSLMGKLKAID